MCIAILPFIIFLAAHHKSRLPLRKNVVISFKKKAARQREKNRNYSDKLLNRHQCSASTKFTNVMVVFA